MEVVLVYPHQLFASHPGLRQKKATVLLVEEPLFFGCDTRWPAAMHKQKLVLHRASMAAWAEKARANGHRVIVAAVDGTATHSAAILDRALPRGVTRLVVCDPCDDVLTRRLRRYVKDTRRELIVLDSPNFLTPLDFLSEKIGKVRKPFMAKFYEAQRKRMHVLLEENGGPVGGKWSFDADNRKRLPAGHVPPAEPACRQNAWVAEAIASVERDFPDRPGDTRSFRWPVTHDDACAWMRKFFAERYVNFGEYEDAICVNEATLYHSAITPMLNVGLLDPNDVLAAALEAEAPLNSREGFVRQLIGWREFMRGMYLTHGVRQRRGNFWNFTRRMPAEFYNGTTGVAPVDRVIRHLLRDGWCHHIERLMILGNFMMLCRIRPDDVYQWFMEMFVDSYDWVMVPNVYGMSQYADGGLSTTKPYLSGSNYIRKMSNEPPGPWCEIWDALYWSFVDDYREVFLRNPRLSMAVRTWDKMPTAKRHAHRQRAEKFLLRWDDHLTANHTRSG